MYFVLIRQLCVVLFEHINTTYYISYEPIETYTYSSYYCRTNEQVKFAINKFKIDQSEGTDCLILYLKISAHIE